MGAVSLLLVSLAVAASARMAFEFPDKAEVLLTSPLDTSFSCDDRIYGYYADVSNNCQVFHVCLPVPDHEGGVADVAHFSFVCGNGTVFSQDALTCMHTEDAMLCEESEGFYEITNSEFGVVNEVNNDVNNALNDDV